MVKGQKRITPKEVQEFNKMEKHELEKLQNTVKSQTLYKIQEYLQDDVVDIDSLNCLGKLYTRIDKGW